MEQNARARDQREQSAVTRQPLELIHGRRGEDCPDPLIEPCELAHDELELLQGKVAGHRWEGWRRLTGGEGYFAACSCGWRGAETSYVSPMLRQVTEHLDAVWAVRGGRPSAQAAPALDQRERSAGQREVRSDERIRELYASVHGQHRRLSQALEHSADVLAASQEQAGRLVAVLEHAAANVAPEWARTWEAAQSAEALQRRAERAKELRTGIVAAAEALAAMVEEVALAGQDPETGCLSGPTGNRRLAGEPADRAGAERAADDLHLARGLGRAAG
jgi:hypothetical protein